MKTWRNTPTPLQDLLLRELLKRGGHRGSNAAYRRYRRHPGVDAGKPFERLQRAGMSTVQPDHIVRQKESELLKTAEHMSRLSEGLSESKRYSSPTEWNTLSLFGLVARLFVVLTFAIEVPAFAAPLSQSQSSPRIVTARIAVDGFSLITVPVKINGSGPYDFLLDTGCNKSIIDQKLANVLGLSRTGRKSVAGVLASVQMSIVHADSLSVAGATVGGGDILSSDQPVTVNNKVRGVLGEDFLRNFDVLIDYRHQVIRLEPGPGLMAKIAVGKHLPLQVSAKNEDLPGNHLVIFGRIREFGDETMSLLVDSGTNQLILFKDDLGPVEHRTEPIRMGNFNQWVASSAATRRIRSLDLGVESIPNLTVVALPRRADLDVNGLIPTCLFDSIFISHFGRYVILNPTFTKSGLDGRVTLARVKAVSCT